MPEAEPQQEQIKCLQMPLENYHLVLPNAMVAEIVHSREVELLGKAPSWLIGKFQWRGVDVPLICFEALCGVAHQTEGKGRVVILYALSNHCAYSYYGLLVQDIPKFFSLDAEMIIDQGSGGSCPYVARRIEVEERSMQIPNISALEESLNSYRTRAVSQNLPN